MFDDRRRRRRRRQRRAAAVVTFMVLALGMAWFFESQATTTVLVVRHADPMPGLENPGLSPAGWVRAEELSRVLGDVDVVQGLDAIFATPYRPTQETADPLARRLGLPVQVVPAADTAGLAARILKDYKGKIVLVVTEPEVVRVLVPEFHGSKKIPPMADQEFDNLYVVSIPWYGKVKTLRLRYGQPPAVASPLLPAPGAALDTVP
jgi:broad specificity phosphatase PhoE